MSVGGDVEIAAGGDITRLSVSLPTTWHAAVDETGKAVIATAGGGDLRVEAGGDLLGGSYFVAKGEGRLRADGDIGRKCRRHRHDSGGAGRRARCRGRRRGQPGRRLQPGLPAGQPARTAVLGELAGLQRALVGERAGRPWRPALRHAVDGRGEHDVRRRRHRAAARRDPAGDRVADRAGRLDRHREGGLAVPVGDRQSGPVRRRRDPLRQPHADRPDPRQRRASRRPLLRPDRRRSGQSAERAEPGHGGGPGLPAGQPALRLPLRQQHGLDAAARPHGAARRGLRAGSGLCAERRHRRRRGRRQRHPARRAGAGPGQAGAGAAPGATSSTCRSRASTSATRTSPACRPAATSSTPSAAPTNRSTAAMSSAANRAWCWPVPASSSCRPVGTSARWPTRTRSSTAARGRPTSTTPCRAMSARPR